MADDPGPAVTPVLPSLPCDPGAIPKLRLGRQVPQHVYLQRRGDQPDEPLCTLPEHIARQMVDAFEALRWFNVHPPSVGVDPDRIVDASLDEWLEEWHHHGGWQASKAEVQRLVDVNRELRRRIRALEATDG